MPTPPPKRGGSIFDQYVLLAAAYGNLGSVAGLTVVWSGGLPVDPEFHSLLRLSIYAGYLSPIAFALAVVRLATGARNPLSLCAASLGFLGSLLWYVSLGIRP